MFNREKQTVAFMESLAGMRLHSWRVEMKVKPAVELWPWQYLNLEFWLDWVGCQA